MGPTGRTAVLLATAALVGGVVSGCGTDTDSDTDSDLDLATAMEIACDGAEITEPEPSSFPDTSPEDWPDATSRLDCVPEDSEELSGYTYDADPARRLAGTSDSVESGDGGSYRWAIGRDGDDYVVVTATTYDDETPAPLRALDAEGMALGG